jgi:hypothetical protein
LWGSGLTFAERADKSAEKPLQCLPRSDFLGELLKRKIAMRTPSIGEGWPQDVQGVIDIILKRDAGSLKMVQQALEKGSLAFYSGAST